MITGNSYYKWFKKVIAVFIELFFVCAILSTLYVFTYAFSEDIKIYLFIVLTLLFSLTVFFTRNIIKRFVNSLLKKLEKLDYQKMLLIIVLTMIILKVFYSLFCFFDPSLGDNDITIYTNIAANTVSNGIDTNEISHLIMMGLHLALFKVLNIPYHIGMFIILLIGTIINFFSFKKLIGKEKTFLILMIYELMPSTVLLSFCPTHEIYLYLYFSLFLLASNLLIETKDKKKTILYEILLTISLCMSIFTNPAGYLLIIVLVLTILLTNLKVLKKVILIVIVGLSILITTVTPKIIGISEGHTDSNTITILICGASVETNGEHVDGYPYEKALEYMNKNNIEFSGENQLEAFKVVLKEEYLYLLTHPIDFVKLIAHKFYIEWSGDHYAVEMANNSGVLSKPIYYILLGISAIIYLLILTLGVIYNNIKDTNVEIDNAKLMILGVMSLLLVTLVLNKYSVYMTAFVYLVSFCNLLNNDKRN